MACRLSLHLPRLIAGHDVVDLSCRLHGLNAARNLVNSSVLLTDRLREGWLQVEAAY